MKRALLIGGTGFVGRHMKHFLSEEYEVISSGSECDITNKKKITTLVEKCRPEIVVNFAFGNNIGSGGIRGATIGPSYPIPLMLNAIILVVSD